MKKRSFFERLTGSMQFDDEEEFEDLEETTSSNRKDIRSITLDDKMPELQEKKDPDEELFGELSVDVYQTANDIIIQTMIAGARPEDIHVSITPEQVVIKGKREDKRSINDENFHIRELYWGAFMRIIDLPQEIDPDEAEATEKNGLLTLKLPKFDKIRKTTLKIKSI